MKGALRLLAAAALQSCACMSFVHADGSIIKIVDFPKGEVHFGPIFGSGCPGSRGEGADFAGYTDDYYDISDKDHFYLAEPTTETFEVLENWGTKAVKEIVGKRVVEIRVTKRIPELHLSISRVSFQAGLYSWGLYSLLEEPRPILTRQSFFTLVSLGTLKLKKPAYIGGSVACTAGARHFLTKYFTIKITTAPEPVEIWLDGKKTSFKASTSLRFPESAFDEIALVLRRPGFATIHKILQTREQKISIKLKPVVPQ